MTLSVVRAYPSTMAGIENAAAQIANSVAAPNAWGWNCAFHHAIDLIAYARGLRRTTRCMHDYHPNELEKRVEQILAERLVWRGMKEKHS